MAYELEVPVRHRTFWRAFTDPERMARAVPGLTVHAVQAVSAADAPEGVSGNVVAGRLKLRVGGPGTSGTTITYRGTVRIAAAEPQLGTLELAVDVAQARGDGALAGVLRIMLRPSGAEAEKTTVSVEPDLELSGRALDLEDHALIEAASSLASQWLSALAEEYQEAEPSAAVVEGDASDVEVPDEREVEVEAESIAETEIETETEVDETTASEAGLEVDTPEVDTAAEDLVASSTASSATEVTRYPGTDSKQPSATVAASSDPLIDDSLSADPLAPVWRGEIEKNPWVPIVAALTLLVIVRRRRRRRTQAR